MTGQPQVGDWMLSAAVTWLQQGHGAALPEGACLRIAQGLAEVLYPYVRVAATADLADQLDVQGDEVAQALARVLDQMASEYLDELRSQERATQGLIQALGGTTVRRSAWQEN